jgi:hypothetical protein
VSAPQAGRYLVLAGTRCADGRYLETRLLIVEPGGRSWPWWQGAGSQWLADRLGRGRRPCRASPPRHGWWSMAPRSILKLEICSFALIRMSLP